MKGILKTLLSVIVMIAVPVFAQYSPPTAAGKLIYDKWCVPCHSSDTSGNYPGTVALQVKYKGKVPAALEERTDLTREMITTYVRHGVSIMPPFRKTEISDQELQVMIDYLVK